MAEEHPISGYQAALRAFNAADAAAQEMVKQVQSVGYKMASFWQFLSITNVNAVFPDGIARGYARTGHPGLQRRPEDFIIDGAEWPTAQEAATVLVAYHDASQLLLEAWSRIPEADQVGLQPPKKKE